MGEYGPVTQQVNELIERVEAMTIDDAVDLYEAHAARILIHGSLAERLALAAARTAAVRRGLEAAYLAARHDAATAWRRAMPVGQGPWLLVSQAITNGAGALVVYESLDEKQVQLLLGPWRQAFGRIEPVGPGTRARASSGRGASATP